MPTIKRPIYIISALFLSASLGMSSLPNPTHAITSTSLVYSSYEEVINAVENGIVTVYNYDYLAYANRYVLASLGSGFVFLEDTTYQYILTNEHVVKDGDRFDAVTYDFNYIDAQLIGKDAQLDVAVLRVPKSTSLQVLKMGDSNYTNVGEEVIAIGNPKNIDLKNTTTVGLIAGIRRNLQGGTTDIADISQMLQIEAAVNPGNSGGPLINMMGEVIGINSMAYTRDNFGEKMETVNFSIPINSALIAAYHIMNSAQGVFDRPNLGYIQFRDIPGLSLTERTSWRVPTGVTQGVMLYPLPSSNLYNAGVENYAHLISFNGVPIQDVYGMRELLYRYTPGDTVMLELSEFILGQGHVHKVVSITLTSTLN
jgi:serine protease Do